MISRKKHLIILFICLSLALISSCVQTPKKEVEIEVNVEEMYANPFELDNEWADYGIGDPYILRYNGTYYLYVSTKDAQQGIKGWSSTDLVNWTYEGLVAEDERTTTAYAPEVVYWNGTFYMYTSPSGQGHYVLSSESPAGPFEVQTENVGMSIDGSVFIDDDGSWYFTHAGHQGIVGHKMSDPYTFGAPIQTSLFLGHWTEGSMIIKKNDHYYMTYTGNHVFSKGYRINYGVSDSDPLLGYSVPEHNPVIINTTEDFYGLGHNSIVLGPNLDSYYAIYHNLIGRSAEGPPVRKMNIDRFVFNGKKMDVLGPTNFKNPIPERPDYEERWTEENQPFVAGEKIWISESSTETHFTAEYNFEINQSSKESEFRVLFSYGDEENYRSVSINQLENKVELYQKVDGKEELLGAGEFPSEFDFTELHTIRVENKLNQIAVFLDGMKKITTGNIGLEAGNIGYKYEDAAPMIGYTAFTNDVDSSSDFEVYKPLPGTIEAVHYLAGENRGFHINTPSEDEVFRQKVPIRLKEDGSYTVLLQDKGDWLKYKVNAKESGLYGISVVVNPEKVNKNTKVQLSINGKTQTYTFPKEVSDFQDDSVKVNLGTIDIKEGFHVLKVMLKSGGFEFDHLEFIRVVNEKVDIQNSLEKIEVDDIHGSWFLNQNGIKSNVTEDMKAYVGDEKWTDYEVEVPFVINDDRMDDAGLLVRVTNESDFEHQVDDSLMGYYIAFNTEKMSLEKLNYNSTQVMSEPISLDEGVEYILRVRVQGNGIEAFLDDNKQPILSYKDPNAYLHGKVGIRSKHSNVLFRKISIKNLK